MLGNTILNREVREDITIKSKALQATLRKSKEKSKCQSPEVAVNVLEKKKRQEATMAGTERQHRRQVTDDVREMPRLSRAL